ncbi:hypothetical protein [Planctomycetes bacterium K23_9]|uniref:Uncharacterized protein n=1 Tax=Stieleria marina TaxID=1930275 RepID=A0A517NQE4_9BACT|nr:hypothetical protein K239x_12880 [Planctomycetes bacterium K23_9]
MRIRRRASLPFLFGIQTLLALIAFSAFMMWFGAFGALIAIASVAVHYSVLSFASVFLARSGGMADPSRYCDWQFVAPDDGTVLRVVVTTFLVFHYVWQLFWLIVMLPAGFPAIWHSRSLGPLSLAHVEHLCLAAFSLLLVTSLLSRAYAGARFSRRICIETSTLLTFLLASHFAIPP